MEILGGNLVKNCVQITLKLIINIHIIKYTSFAQNYKYVYTMKQVKLKQGDSTKQKQTCT